MKYTYEHLYYTADHLNSLLRMEQKRGETLVRRYLKWNNRFITVAQSGRYSYEELKGFRKALGRLHNDVVDFFAGEYPLHGWKEIELPCSKSRWKSEMQGKLSGIRNQRWRELLRDNRRCEALLLEQGEDPANFCGNCHHFFTQEEIDMGECACCQTHFYNDSYMNEEDYWED